MPRPRLTFDTPLTRDESPVMVAGRVGAAEYGQRQRLADQKAAIRALAREAFIRRRQISYLHHDRCRYVYRRLRDAWRFALEDAAPGMRSDGGMVAAMLHEASEALWQIRLFVMANMEREDTRGEQRVRAASARAQRTKQQAPDKTHALNLAAEMKQRNPSLSNREIARLLEAEIGKPAGTIRRWLAG